MVTICNSNAKILKVFVNLFAVEIFLLHVFVLIIWFCDSYAQLVCCFRN